MTINTETLRALLEKNRDDRQALDFLFEALRSFEEYHSAVIAMETVAAVYCAEALGSEDYNRRITDADRQRTAAHNALLAMLGALNRLAERNGLPPVYDGTISEKQPYRRQAADAVFAWLQGVIENRT